MHVCAYICSVEFEWDARKAVTNLRKHRVDFADAATALHDDAAVTVPDDCPGERRHVALAADATGRVLVVIYIWRGERVRLISARRATPRERKRCRETE